MEGQDKMADQCDRCGEECEKHSRGMCNSCYAKWWRRTYPDRHKHQKRKSYLRKYDMTVAEYEDMLQDQGGVCAVCGQEETATGNCDGVKRLAVDHDHKTGEVRGLLCHKCNIALGHLEDDPSLLDSMKEYLSE